MNIKMRTYGYDSVKLANAYTTLELVELRRFVENEVKNLDPAFQKGSLYKFTKNARKKLNNIDWAITYKLSENNRSQQ